MSIPYSSDSIGNVLRLQGLKNVRKKVLPGAEFLNNLDAVDTDVAGTSSDVNASAANLPALETGNELSAQSYDVRANQVIPPSPPPIETQQVEESEGLPPVNPEMQEQQPVMSANTNLWKSVGNALKQYGEPFVNQEKRKEVTAQNNALLEDAQLRSQGLNPEEEMAKEAEIEDNTQSAIQEGITRAQENPLEVAVYGATDEVAKNPELVKEFREITGTDFTPEIAEMTKNAEKILSDMEGNLNAEGKGYSEQAKRLKERIDANAATDMDKYYIGLALIMPLLIGGIFGKEAGLGALAGSAKGLAETFQNRIQDTRKNEELLADINKNQGLLDLKKGELQLERLKIPEQIRKNLPKDEREFLKGKKEVAWVDPKTGERKAGVEVKPGLIALPEYLTDKEDLKELKKEAGDISEAKTATQLINSLTDDIIDISSKLKNKDWLTQGFRTYLLGKRPDLSSKFSEKVEFEGRPVNAAVVLEHKLKLLTDAYRQAKGMRALTSTVQEHIDGLFRNPATSFQNYEDTIDQMLYTRSLAQKNLIQNASNKGFAPEFLEEEFGKKNKSVYNKLNKKEEEKQSSELLRE
jgi:hypothetical protein